MTHVLISMSKPHRTGRSTAAGRHNIKTSGNVSLYSVCMSPHFYPDIHPLIPLQLKQIFFSVTCGIVHTAMSLIYVSVSPCSNIYWSCMCFYEVKHSNPWCHVIYGCIGTSNWNFPEVHNFMHISFLKTSGILQDFKGPENVFSPPASSYERWGSHWFEVGGAKFGQSEATCFCTPIRIEQFRGFEQQHTFVMSDPGGRVLQQHAAFTEEKKNCRPYLIMMASLSHN